MRSGRAACTQISFGRARVAADSGREQEEREKSPSASRFFEGGALNAYYRLLRLFQPAEFYEARCPGRTLAGGRPA